MQIKRLNITKKALMVFFGSLIISHAFAAQPVVEGADYTVITTPVPATPEPKGKVNVKEFFSFTCIHCKDIEPMVDSTLVPNKKIDMKRIQVAWDPTTSNYAKLNITIEMMNLSKLYTPAFTATFAHQDLNDPATLKTFLTQNGLNKDQVDKFMSTYNSFTVTAKVGENKNLMTTYNISGTPTFIVADKYMVKPALPARLIEVVQYLVNKSATAK